MPRTPNETIPSQFRLRPEDLQMLDWLCVSFSELKGAKLPRAEVLRVLIAEKYKARGGPEIKVTPKPPRGRPRKK